MHIRIMLAWIVVLSMSTVFYNVDHILPAYKIISDTRTYCAKMIDGKLVMVSESNVITADVRLRNGTVIMPNGVIEKKDGKKILLNEGECIDGDGKVIDQNPKKK